MTKAAAVLVLDGPRVLTFSKYDKHGLSLPCGKIEADETPAECALRECMEETGLAVAFVDQEPFCGFDVEGGCLVYTYLAKYTGGDLVASGEGLPQWGSIAEIAYGPFWHYNQRLLRHFNISIPLIGKFHSHLTISAKSDAEANRSAALVKGKITVIDLARGDQKQTDYMITHHYVTGFHGLEDSSDIVTLLKSMGRQISESGTTVTRVKLEHELLDKRSDRRDIESSLGSVYTEVHVKCVVTESRRDDLLAFASSEGWHPSRNPFSKSDDGHLTQFVNRRFYGKTDLRDIDTSVDALIPGVIHICEVKEIKYESAVFDSNEGLDGWWMK